MLAAAVAAEFMPEQQVQAEPAAAATAMWEMWAARRLLAQPILAVAAVAALMEGLRAVTAEQEVQELFKFDTWAQRVDLAEPLQQLVVIQFTPSLRPAPTQHKDKSWH
jgi:hypothetical protein